mmetsp:Transcript_5127/g.10290  ORF Transcript_5127/g.10290 Transcript_5127/m.10290 type:complete len:227 (-) Transcript_5127:39-719(-)
MRGAHLSKTLGRVICSLSPLLRFGPLSRPHLEVTVIEFRLALHVSKLPDDRQPFPCTAWKGMPLRGLSLQVDNTSRWVELRPSSTPVGLLPQSSPLRRKDFPRQPLLDPEHPFVADQPCLAFLHCSLNVLRYLHLLTLSLLPIGLNDAWQPRSHRQPPLPQLRTSDPRLHRFWQVELVLDRFLQPSEREFVPLSLCSFVQILDLAHPGTLVLPQFGDPGPPSPSRG